MENSSNNGMRSNSDRSNNQGQNLDHDNDNMQNMQSSSDAVDQQRDKSWDNDSAQHAPLQSAHQGGMAGNDGYKDDNNEPSMDDDYDMSDRDRSQGGERAQMRGSDESGDINSNYPDYDIDDAK